MSHRVVVGISGLAVRYRVVYYLQRSSSERRVYDTENKQRSPATRFPCCDFKLLKSKVKGKSFSNLSDFAHWKIWSFHCYSTLRCRILYKPKSLFQRPGRKNLASLSKRKELLVSLPLVSIILILLARRRRKEAGVTGGRGLRRGWELRVCMPRTVQRLLALQRLISFLRTVESAAFPNLHRQKESSGPLQADCSSTKSSAVQDWEEQATIVWFVS